MDPRGPLARTRGPVASNPWTNEAMTPRTTTGNARSEIMGSLPSRRKAQRSHDALDRVMAVGVRRAAAIAISRWVRAHSRSHDWTYAQLAEEGGCDSTTICRAVPILEQAGLVIQIQDPILARRSEECRAGLWIFTQALFDLVFQKKTRCHRAAKSPSPGRSSTKIAVPSEEETVQRKHRHKAAAARSSHAHAAPEGAQEDRLAVHDDTSTRQAEEAPRLEALEDRLVVAMAEATGMDPQGVRHAAPDLPPDLRTEEAAREVGRVVLAMAQARSLQPGKTIQHITYGILRRLDRQIIATVRGRMERARAAVTAARGSGAEAAWAHATPLFRAMPGAREALVAWHTLLASAPSPRAAGYLAHQNQKREARAAVLVLAEASLGQAAGTLREDLRRRLEAADMKEGSLVWKRAWNHGCAMAFAQAACLDLGT